MTEPNYYIQFRKRYDEQYLVETFIESFEVNDWKELFHDLSNGRPYPVAILDELTDLDVLTTFAAKIKYASASTRLKAEQAINGIIDDNIELESSGSSALFATLIETSRFLEKGITASRLIKRIILDQRHNPSTRFDAGIALARYNEEEATDFWIGPAKELLPSNQFLSFPRFLHFFETNTLEAVYSLRYFEKTEYINEDDLFLQISYFLLRVSQTEAELDLVRNNYFLFNSWLQEFIHERVLTATEFSNIKSNFTNRPNIESIYEDVRFLPLDVSSNISAWTKTDFVEFINIKNSINARLRHYLPNYIHGIDWVDVDTFYHGSAKVSNIVKFWESETYYHARTAFRKSEVRDALSGYKHLLDRVYKKKALDKHFLLVYPQILTDVGYMCTARLDFRFAKEIFFDSIQICHQLAFTEYHNLILENTVNILGLSSFEPHLNPDWDKDLLEMLARLKPSDQTKQIGLASGDIYYYLCNGYYRVRNLEDFYKSFQIGIQIAKDSKDMINEIKLFVLKILLENQTEEIQYIRLLITQLDTERRKDPKITSLLPSLKILLDKEHSPIEEIEAIFEENDIVIS